MSRILKWTVPLDDKWHQIGKGPVALVAEIYRDPDYMSLEGDFANVWTVERDDDKPTVTEKIMVQQGATPKVRVAKVVGTNQIYLNECEHLGSYRSGRWVWHVIAKMVLPGRINETNT